MAVRAVSLVPSITETLIAWGLAPVAVTRFCEQPGLATVGGTKNPDIDAICGLQPDVVLMDREENRAEDASALVSRGVRVHATHVCSLGDVPPTLAGLRSVMGLGPTRELRSVPGPGPGEEIPHEENCEGRLAVFVPIWRRPWMGLGAATYGSSLLWSAGARNVLGSGDRSDRYPAVDLAEVASLGVDAVLAPSEPYHFDRRHVADLEVVAPVTFVDGQDLFWWGARTAGAKQRLAALVGKLLAATS